MRRKSWIVVGVLVALWAIGSMLPPRDVVRLFVRQTIADAKVTMIWRATN
jgi:hypothetical protein